MFSLARWRRGGAASTLARESEERSEADGQPAEAALYLFIWLLFSITFGFVTLSTNPALWILGALYALVITAVLSRGSGVGWFGYHAACLAAALLGLCMASALHMLLPPPSEESARVMNVRAMGMTFVVSSATLALALLLPRHGYRIFDIPADGAAGAGKVSGEYPIWAHQNADSLSEREQVRLARCLLHHRCFWTGQLTKDYVFFISQEHSFIGCLFSHQLHPYDRGERSIILLFQCMMISFPVAAITVMMEKSPLKAVCVFICVTAPRNGLKAYMKRIVVDSETICLDSGAGVHGRKSGAAMKWEVYFLCVTALFVLALACACCFYIVRHTHRPLMTVLVESSDGLCFAFILELLIMLILPHPARCVKGEPWTYGFFNQWRVEGEHVRSGGSLEPPIQVRA